MLLTFINQKPENILQYSSWKQKEKAGRQRPGDKAQATEDNRGVSTGFTWSTEPPVSGERRLFRN